MGTTLQPIGVKHATVTASTIPNAILPIPDTARMTSLRVIYTATATVGNRRLYAVLKGDAAAVESTRLFCDTLITAGQTHLIEFVPDFNAVGVIALVGPLFVQRAYMPAGLMMTPGAIYLVDYFGVDNADSFSSFIASYEAMAPVEMAPAINPTIIQPAPVSTG